MFALGVELLMRRAIMARWDSREQPEWPPHPDRVFMALVAAWGENGAADEGRTALEWLEALPIPALRVSEEASFRARFISYVPVNDDNSPISKKGKPETPLGSLPFGRGRNGRSFPAVAPAAPKFFLRWEVDVPDNLRPKIEELCGQVTYLGHSSSPVRLWVEMDDQTTRPNLFPTEGSAPFRLRVFGPGRIADLIKCYETDFRPIPALWSGYTPRAEPHRIDAVSGPFDPALIILRQTAGRKFSLESCGMLADALRDTLMSRFGPAPPEWLSGHTPERGPSHQHRPAYLPLAFTGSEHADGHVLGVGIALPADFPREDTDKLFALLMQHDESDEVAADGVPFLRLRVMNTALGRFVGEMHLELDERAPRQRAKTLQPDTWLGPSDQWTTISPVVLPQFPRRHLSPEEVIAQACEDAGYTRPLNVRASFAPAMIGVPHSRSFHVRPRRDGRPPRPLTHAIIQFAQPIRGPVLVGAGRYAGFGVCRPILDKEGLK